MWNILNMTKASKISKSPPAAVANALTTLGKNIRTARLRRKLRIEDLAERIGVSRYVVSDIEKGKPSTSVAAYMGALWVLGLIDQMREVAHPDNDGEGKILERARSPKTARKKRVLDNDF